MENISKALAEQAKSHRQEKQHQKKNREVNTVIFELWEKLQGLKVEVSLYEEGYQEFKGEYLQAEQLKTQLLDMGYTFESAERLYLNFQEKNRRLNEVLAEVRRQQRIGKKIMQEQKERMQSRDKQKSRERGGESRDL